jgi:hypothetical protein
MQISTPLWIILWRCLKKLKIELSHDPDIPLLGIYPKEIKSIYQRNTCTAMFVIALCRIAKYGFNISAHQKG